MEKQWQTLLSGMEWRAGTVPLKFYEVNLGGERAIPSSKIPRWGILRSEKASATALRKLLSPVFF